MKRGSKRFKIFFTCQFVRINQAFCVCYGLFNNKQRKVPFFGFCLKVFRQAGLLQRVDCSTPMQNNLRTQRRVGSSRTEPGVSNLWITNQLSYRRRSGSTLLELSPICLNFNSSLVWCSFYLNGKVRSIPNWVEPEY